MKAQIKKESAFEESEKKFRLLFDNSADPALLLDGDIFIDCNEAALRLLCYAQKGQLIGLRPFDISPERQPDGLLSSRKARQHIDLAFNKGSSRLQWVHRDAYDREFWVDVSLTAIPDRGRQLLYTVWRDISEHKRAEEALRSAHRQVLDIIEFLPDATFVIDRERKVIAWNRAMEKMTGVEKGEILGKGDYSYAIPFYGESRPMGIDLVFEKNTELDTRYTYVKREGGAFLAEAYVPMVYQGRGAYLWGTASPLFDGKGHTIGAIESIRDLSENKRVEKELRESEKRYRGLFETLPDGFASVGMNKCFIEANASLQAMVGYTQEELRCLSYEDLTPKKWHAFEESIVERQVLTRGYSDVFEKEYMRKDGTLFPVELRAHLLRDKGGNPIEMWAFVRDITRRKRSEEALKETEERYRTVVHLSPAGILIHVDGRLEFANPAFARMLGAGSQEELRGKRVRNFIHPDYRDLAEERNRRITLDGKAVPLIEEKFLRADGVAIDVEVTSFPFRYQGRDGVMVVVEDITLRKGAEEALRHRERELEEKSANLEDANTALKVLLRHREEDKRTLESTILANIKELVFPYIEKLRSRNLTEDQVTCLGIIESNLNEVISPFLRKMTAVYTNFTPMEIQIANLIKSGRTSKEIAEILKIGTGTVHTHRNNIRSKLGLSNKEINLRTYLLSLQE